MRLSRMTTHAPHTIRRAKGKQAEVFAEEAISVTDLCPANAKTNFLFEKTRLIPYENAAAFLRFA